MEKQLKPAIRFKGLLCITGVWGQDHQQAKCKKYNDCIACDY